MKKVSNFALTAIIIFAAYNLVVFLLLGVSDHGAAFWLSYALEIVTMLLVCFNIFRTAKREKDLQKLVFLGYPILAWSWFFIVLETVVSLLFMIIDKAPKLAAALQILILAAYAVIVLMCRSAEDIVTGVIEQRQANISMMKSLTVKAASLPTMSKEPDIRKRLEALAEKFKFSDVVSSPETEQAENELGIELGELEQLISGDKDAVNQKIDSIETHLQQRNLQCQRSKRRM